MGLLQASTSRRILWGIEVYNLLIVFVHVVGSLLVPTCFLLQNIPSRISNTASVLVFHGVRGFYQICTLLLLQSDLVEGWRNLVHVPEFPYRTIEGKHGKHHEFSRLAGVGVYTP